MQIDIDQIDLTGEVPVREPERQYYFMAKVSGYVKRRSEELGRPMTFCTQTFGCQMNSRDSEKLEGILEAVGFVQTDTEEADFVLYNTCTVRENANLKVYGRLGVFKQPEKRKILI